MADKKRAGNKLRIPAQEWNTTLDVNRLHRAGALKNADSSPKVQPATGADIVYVQNGTGSDITVEKGIMGIGSAVVPFETDEQEFNYNASILGVAPSDPDKFVVCWSPVESSQFTRATLSGLVTCKVDIEETFHTHAQAGGFTDRLVSSASGSGYILWRPRPDEKGIQDCLVRLSNPSLNVPSLTTTTYLPPYLPYQGYGFSEDSCDRVDYAFITTEEGCVEVWAREIEQTVALVDGEIKLVCRPKNEHVFVTAMKLCDPGYTGYYYNEGTGEYSGQGDDLTDFKYSDDCKDIFTYKQFDTDETSWGSTDMILSKRTVDESEEFVFTWNLYNDTEDPVRYILDWTTPGFESAWDTAKGSEITIPALSSLQINSTLTYEGDSQEIAIGTPTAQIIVHLLDTESLEEEHGEVSNWYECATNQQEVVFRSTCIDGDEQEFSISGYNLSGVETVIQLVYAYNGEVFYSDTHTWVSDDSTITFTSPSNYEADRMLVIQAWVEDELISSQVFTVDELAEECGDTGLPDPPPDENYVYVNDVNDLDEGNDDGGLWKDKFDSTLTSDVKTLIDTESCTVTWTLTNVTAGSLAPKLAPAGGTHMSRGQVKIDGVNVAMGAGISNDFYTWLAGETRVVTVVYTWNGTKDAPDGPTDILEGTEGTNMHLHSGTMTLYTRNSIWRVGDPWT